MIGREGRIDFIYPSFPVMAQQVFPEKIEKLVGIVDVSAKKKEEAKELGSRSNRLYHYSLQLYKRGLFEQALSPLRKSMELDDNYTWSHNLMGIILWRKGDLEGSIKEFQKAIRLDKKNSSAYLNYGLSLFYNKQYAEAENNIKSSISLMDRVAEAHYILGWIYKRTERMDDALQEMKRSLELFEEIKTSPVIYESSVFQRISVHNTLAQLYIESGDIQTALGLLQKGMQIALGIESKTDMDQLHRGKDLMLYE
jgi:tetratricopeptide (TPR) repeat protein